MLKNKKGFTLIESIITIAMFAILGTMLVAGFSTVIRHMGEAAEIKNSTNEVFSTVDKATTENGKTNVTIEIEGQGTIYEEGISVFSDAEEIDGSFSVTLNNFFKSNVATNTTLPFFEELLEFLEDVKDMTNDERDKEFKEEKEDLEEENITIDYILKPGLSNDNLRWYYYVVENEGKGYPELDRNIIEEANRIYDEVNPLYPNNPARIGNKKLYMKPYYINSISKFVLSGETGNTPSTHDGWKCKLLFNPDDKSWYYKIPHVENTWNSEPTDANLILTELGKIQSIEEWYIFQNDLIASGKWRKIEMN